ncbi:hypothetical protein [Fibrisoma limi]|uniref:hypothetical protein n=1 Tax=Fibrisoma limi TaxID=663275 RepID=UPI000587A28F|nr:hypothetical protein [Fibrisoma limi]
MSRLTQESGKKRKAIAGHVKRAGIKPVGFYRLRKNGKEFQPLLGIGNEQPDLVNEQLYLATKERRVRHMWQESTLD